MDKEFAGLKDKRIVNAIGQVIKFLLDNDFYKTEKYLSEKLVVRATRRIFKGKIVKGNVEVLLVVGKPNFAQRQFIKDCKKAGEEFPIGRIQIKEIPKKKKHGK